MVDYIKSNQQQGKYNSLPNFIKLFVERDSDE